MEKNVHQSILYNKNLAIVMNFFGNLDFFDEIYNHYILVDRKKSICPSKKVQVKKMLTEQKVYDAIKKISKSGKIPTIAEISKFTKENQTPANAVINLLITQGKIKFKKAGNARVLFLGDEF